MTIDAQAALSFEVTEADTAIALGSGDVPVLATPRLVAWLEAATCAAAAPRLRDGETTVGIRVEIDHRAASRVGDTVVATARVTFADERTLRFEVAATDQASGRVLGGGTVTRAVVDRERFQARSRS